MSLRSFFMVLLMGGSTLLQVQAKSLGEAPHHLDELLQVAATMGEDAHIIKETERSGLAEVSEYQASALPLITSRFGVNRGWQPKKANPYNALISGMTKSPVADDGYDVGYDYLWSVDFRSPIFSFGRLGAVYKIAQLQTAMVQAEARWRQQQYYLKVVQYYINALLAQSRFEVAVQSHHHAQSLRDFVDLEFKEGSRSKIDFLRMQAAAGMAAAEKQKRMLDAETALLNLKAVIGLDANTNLVLPKGHRVQAAFLALQNADDQSVIHQLKLLRRQMAAKTMDYQRSLYWPTLFVSGNVANQIVDRGLGSADVEAKDIADPDYFTYKVGLGFSWTLFDSLATPSRIRKAGAQDRIAERQLTAFVREHRIAMTSSARQLTIAKQIHEASAGNDKAAKLFFEKTDSDYRSGAATLSDSLEAQNERSQRAEQFSQAYLNTILVHAHYLYVRGVSLLRRGK